MFGVRVIKQGIVPCKLLIAASEIAVFVGCNITDATPIFFEAPHCSTPSGKQHRAKRTYVIMLIAILIRR